MATIEHSAILKAPPERVFALLERVEDFADYSDLIHAIPPCGEPGEAKTGVASGRGR